MRYIVTDARPIELPEVAHALPSINPAYRLELGGRGGVLYHSNTPIGQLELNVPGDGLFDEEIGELHEFAEEASGAAGTMVRAALREASGILAVQVLGGTDRAESLLGPMWAWLFMHRAGLLQADGEGYSDAHGLILAVD
jgi:hypothetical protein